MRHFIANEHEKIDETMKKEENVEQLRNERY